MSAESKVNGGRHISVHATVFQVFLGVLQFQSLTLPATKKTPEGNNSFAEATC